VFGTTMAVMPFSNSIGVERQRGISTDIDVGARHGAHPPAWKGGRRKSRARCSLVARVFRLPRHAVRDAFQEIGEEGIR
jgi:hypothetical protein